MTKSIPIPVIVIASMDSCVPCARIMPVVAALADRTRERVEVRFLSDSEDEDMLSKLGVDRFPTLLRMVEGEVTDRLVGYAGPEEIEEVESFFGAGLVGEPPRLTAAEHARIATAEAALDAVMERPSEEIAPHVEALNAAIMTARSEARQRAEEQGLDRPAALRLMHEAGLAATAPWSALLQAFRSAQEVGLALYAQITGTDAVATILIEEQDCDADGSCRRPPRVAAEYPGS